MLASSGAMGTVHVSEHVEWRAIEDEVVVLDLRTELYLSFNASGAVLWCSLAEGATNDELVQRLITGFDVDEEQARADVNEFVEELLERGLVERVAAESNPAG